MAGRNLRSGCCEALSGCVSRRKGGFPAGLRFGVGAPVEVHHLIGAASFACGAKQSGPKGLRNMHRCKPGRDQLDFLGVLVSRIRLPVLPIGKPKCTLPGVKMERPGSVGHWANGKAIFNWFS